MFFIKNVFLCFCVGVCVTLRVIILLTRRSGVGLEFVNREEGPFWSEGRGRPWAYVPPVSRGGFPRRSRRWCFLPPSPLGLVLLPLHPSFGWLLSSSPCLLPPPQGGFAVSLFF